MDRRKKSFFFNMFDLEKEFSNFNLPPENKVRNDIYRSEEIAEKLYRDVIKSSQFDNPVVIDFAGMDFLRKKALDKLLAPLRRISNSKTILIINFDKDQFEIFKTTGVYQYFREKSQILPVFLNDNHIEWVGIDDSEEHIIRAISAVFFNGRIALDDLYSIFYEDQIEDFMCIIHENPNLFKIEGNDVEFVISRLDYSEIYNERFQKRFLMHVKKYALNKLSGEEGYFYFRSGDYYTKSFIEVRRLLEIPNINKEIRFYLKNLFKNSDINLILSSTPSGRELSEILASALEINFTYFQNYYFREHDEPIYPIKEGDKVIILTDVIGKFSRINKLIERVRIKKANLVNIYSLIDTRENNGEGVEPSDRLIQFPIQKITSGEKPLKIAAIIDSSTSSLMKILKKSNILPIIKDVDIFWEIIKETKACFCRHSYFGTLHHECYINPKILLENKKWFTFIKLELNKILTDSPEYILITESSEIKDMQNQIARLFSLRTTVIKVESDRRNRGKQLYMLSDTYVKELKSKDVAIFDSGTVTGYTIKSLRDIALSHGVRSITFIIFINRLKMEHIEQIMSISHQRIKMRYIYLYDLNIPSYDQAFCPICNYTQQLNDRKLIFNSTRALNQIYKICKKLEPINLSKEDISSQSYYESDEEEIEYMNLLDIYFKNKNHFFAKLKRIEVPSKIENMLYILDNHFENYHDIDKKDEIIGICKKIVLSEEVSIDKRSATNYTQNWLQMILQ